MRDPKRVLSKILGKDVDLASFEASGEDLLLLVETLREISKIRKIRQWLREHTGIETALAPEAFHQLLDLREINYTEVIDRNLDVRQESLKNLRQPGDPVSVANLNVYLRELFRDLNTLHQLKTKEYPQLLLGTAMTGDLVERIGDDVNRLRGLKQRLLGYLLTGWKAKEIEKQFEALFPEARGVHPLRHHITEIQLELGFYRRCLDINIKWAATGMDLFRILRGDLLHQTLQNVGAAGSGLWNVVYNGMQMKTCMELVGVRFQDAATLFDPEQVPLAAA